MSIDDLLKGLGYNIHNLLDYLNTLKEPMTLLEYYNSYHKV